eukprot:388513_1
MAMPQFALRLCGPTSTSKQIEIASQFGGDYGMVIQLSNCNNHHLTGLSCAWLSNYSGEDETLFCGGQYHIKIESVRIKSALSTRTYKRDFRILYQLDCMLTGVLGIPTEPHVSVDDQVTALVLKKKLS